jgi:hypothetical protein
VFSFFSYRSSFLLASFLLAAGLSAAQGIDSTHQSASLHPHSGQQFPD